MWLRDCWSHFKSPEGLSSSKYKVQGPQLLENHFYFVLTLAMIHECSSLLKTFPTSQYDSPTDDEHVTSSPAFSSFPNPKISLFLLNCKKSQRQLKIKLHNGWSSATGHQNQRPRFILVLLLRPPVPVGLPQPLLLRSSPRSSTPRPEQPSPLPVRPLRRANLRHLLHFPSQAQPPDMALSRQAFSDPWALQAARVEPQEARLRVHRLEQLHHADPAPVEADWYPRDPHRLRWRALHCVWCWELVPPPWFCYSHVIGTLCFATQVENMCISL